MGTCRTIACTAIVKGLSLTPPTGTDKNPTCSMTNHCAFPTSECLCSCHLSAALTVPSPHPITATSSSTPFSIDIPAFTSVPCAPNASNIAAASMFTSLTPISSIPLSSTISNPSKKIALFELTIIYVPLAPLTINPTLPADYKDSKVFFRSLFRSSPYSTHKFHKFNPHWKCNYATWAHSLEHKYFCREVYCHYHM